MFAPLVDYIELVQEPFIQILEDLHFILELLAGDYKYWVGNLDFFVNLSKQCSSFTLSAPRSFFLSDLFADEFYQACM